MERIPAWKQQESGKLSLKFRCKKGCQVIYSLYIDFLGCSHNSSYMVSLFQSLLYKFFSRSTSSSKTTILSSFAATPDITVDSAMLNKLLSTLFPISRRSRATQYLKSSRNNESKTLEATTSCTKYLNPHLTNMTSPMYGNVPEYPRTYLVTLSHADVVL